MAAGPPQELAIDPIVAPNPGPMTGRGTNTYVLRDDAGGCLVIDPGPAIDSHLEAIRAAAPGGRVDAVLLTHHHSDHTEAVAPLGAPVLWPPSAAGAGPGAGLDFLDLETPIGTLKVLRTPGHAADHVCFVSGWPRAPLVFCGDLILGEGSSIVMPRAAGGSMADYMRSLDRVELLDAVVMWPGHGPTIEHPEARIAEYREHRMMRERRLVDALGRGERRREALLEAAWHDVPPGLRPAADVAMEAHLEKLREEGRLPDGVPELASAPSDPEAP